MKMIVMLPISHELGFVVKKRETLEVVSLGFLLEIFAKNLAKKFVKTQAKLRELEFITNSRRSGMCAIIFLKFIVVINAN